MRAPYSWLKDYVDINLSPEELANRLTLAGLEVDRVDYGWPGIETAEIVWLERIKGSDHLSATRVTNGTEEFSVVCGATNIKLHDKVPLARVGTKVGDVTIQAKKAMGVLSEGMLCSPRELGLSDDHSGILILPPETPLGVPLGKVIGEAVIDLDIKAHRGDLFCMVGIAREIAAFTGHKLRQPHIELKEKGTTASKLMKLEVRDPDLCPRYTARVIRNVKLGPSPQWMADRLTLAGMRPINNVVDITNYVMLELGQPLHAFDYDKVADHTIIVRRAEPGEELTTLDGVTRKLTPDMLLITDPAGPNVIAGIFGGARVEVDEGTTSVILEAAHFDPTNVRRTSVALGLRTESSGRFEKNPDIELTAVAIDRAAQLISQLAGGAVAPGRVDFYPEPVKPRHIDFHPSQIEWLTGMTVTRTETIDSLRALGFGVEEEDASDDLLHITVPTWRSDVDESADLVEEVARIVGYDRIPSIVPTGPLPPPLHDKWFPLEDHIREILVGAGLTETMTYTLTSRATMAKLLLSATPGDEALLAAPVPAAGDGADGANGATPALAGTGTRAAERRQIEALAERLPAITLRNPLTSELESLRLTLMASLLGVVRENSKHEDAGLWFFELGRRYLPTPELAAGTGLADERRTLAIALSGPLAQSWLGERDADFFDLKGIVETLLNSLHVSSYRFIPAQHPTFHPGRAALLQVLTVADNAAPEDGTSASRAVVEATWQTAAVLGEVHPEVAARFDLQKRTYLLEMDLERLFQAVPQQVLQQPIPRYPAAERDLAVVVEQTVPAAEVLAVIRASGGELLRDMRLFDVYTGEGIPTGKKSLAYALTYQSAERTLTDQEVEQAQQSVVKALADRLGAALRS
ncbi:MAG: phenylalanine--tRNA ligase subunit beta [Ktedonobacterales bacterium]